MQITYQSKRIHSNYHCQECSSSLNEICFEQCLKTMFKLFNIKQNIISLYLFYY